MKTAMKTAMKTKIIKQLVSASALALVTASTANAAFTITLQQVGGNVVATGSGSVTTNGLTLAGTSTIASQMTPASGLIYLGPTLASTDNFYNGFSGPTQFGIGGNNLASSGTGAYVGLAAFNNRLFLPTTYVSGSALSASSTYFGSLSTLGLTPGTYTWTWSSGATADSFTVNVQAVPEPSTMALGAVGAGMMMFGLRRKNRAV